MYKKSDDKDNFLKGEKVLQGRPIARIVHDFKQTSKGKSLVPRLCAQGNCGTQFSEHLHTPPLPVPRKDIK